MIPYFCNNLGVGIYLKRQLKHPIIPACFLMFLHQLTFFLLPLSTVIWPL